MPQFTIKSAAGGGVEVTDNDKNATYTFSNTDRESGISIFENSHHGSIDDQPNWVNKGSLTFDISDEKLLESARDTLKKVGFRATWAGSRRRRPSRKYKKSSKRVFRKKSRSTRRR
jgi:hypothetical protein